MMVKSIIAREPRDVNGKIRQKYVNSIKRANKKQKSPVNESQDFLARCKGLEPLTFWFVAKHSIQLS